MSAPLRLCVVCGGPERDHDTSVYFGMRVILCEKAGEDQFIVREAPTAWPLGGGKWQVKM
jgi:hypothetical protein